MRYARPRPLPVAAASLTPPSRRADLGITYDLTSMQGTGTPITIADNRNNTLAVFECVAHVRTRRLAFPHQPPLPLLIHRAATCWACAQTWTPQTLHSPPSPRA